MKEEYFENPEQTKKVFEILIEKRKKELLVAIENKNRKGDKALPPDEFAIFSAQMALEDALKRQKNFVEELERRNEPVLGG